MAKNAVVKAGAPELIDAYTGEVYSRRVQSARVSHGRRFVFDCVGPSRTRQEFADECDINSIMKRYQKLGVVSHINPRAPQYVDFSGAPDFHTAMNLMIDAEAAFMRLPSSVRRSMDNDPQKFVSFALDPANLDKMREWGLAEPAKPQEQPPAPPAAQQPAAPAASPGAPQAK